MTALCPGCPLAGERGQVRRISLDLEALGPEPCRLVLIDVRGFGDSDAAPLDGCFAPAAAATDILAVLDALQVERAVISGEGYAGHAATQFAVSHPERTLRLALNNSYASLARAESFAALNALFEQPRS